MESLDIGLEALSYQGPNGLLATRLEKLFDMVLAIKKKTNGGPRAKTKAVKRFVLSNKFTEEFHAIVKKYNGLDLSFKFFTEGVSYVFAIGLDPNDNLTEIDDSFDYSNYKTETPNSKEVREMMERVQKSLDKDTGIITDPKAADEYITTEAKLYLCINSAFCPELFHEKATAHTSKELVAVTLHELGHVTSVIDYASFMQRTLSEYTKPIKLNITNEKELKKALKDAAEYIKACEETTEPNDYTENAKKVILKLEEVLQDKPNLNVFKSVICHLATGVLLVVMFPITLLFALDIIGNIWSEDILNTLAYNKKQSKKDSDFKRTRAELTDTEFRADEYVATFGLSDELVMALSRMRTNSLIVSPGTSVPVHLGQTMLPYHMNVIMARLFSPYLSIIECHGTDEGRYTSIKQTLIKQMKVKDMPPKLMEDLVIQYQNIQTIIKAESLNAKKNHTEYQRYGDIIRIILTANGFMNWVINGKADKHYVEMMRLAKRMNNNELTFQQRRLEV